MVLIWLTCLIPKYRTKNYSETFQYEQSFSNYTWCIQLTNKNAQTITEDFSDLPILSKQKPNKIESDPAKEF